MAYREDKAGGRRMAPGREAGKTGKKTGFQREAKAGRKPGYRPEDKAVKRPGERTTAADGRDRHGREDVKGKAAAEWNNRTEADMGEIGDGSVIEGRNAVMEAFRSGRPVDRLYIQDGCHDGPGLSIKREAQKQSAMIKYVEKERLDQMSETGRHQGVIAVTAAYEYASVEDILQAAEEKKEPPFLILLDNIEDPHNLGAIIRTANLAGAHGVIIPKNRAVGLTSTVARTSAGALNYTPVAKVTNLGKTIEDLKKQGLWFVCADMEGTPMYRLDLKGPVGLVIGSEGEGVSRLVKEKCDLSAAIPMRGNIDSLNASVAAGVLAYEIVRQRLN